MRCPKGARPSRLPVQCLQQPVHLLVKAKQASCNSPVFSTFSVLPWPSSILSAVTILSWPWVFSTSFANGSFTVSTLMPRPAARPSSPQPLGRGHSPCSTTMLARIREVDVLVRVLMRALFSESAHLEPKTSSHASHHCTLDPLGLREGTRVSPSRLPVVLHPCSSSTPAATCGHRQWIGHSTRLTQAAVSLHFVVHSRTQWRRRRVFYAPPSVVSSMWEM